MLMRRVLLLILSMCLFSCAMRKIAYKFADTYIVNHTNDAFDLNPQQKIETKANAKKLMQWHSHNELPLYQKFLDDLLIRTQKPLTQSDMTWVYDELFQFGGHIALQVSVLGTPLLVSLTDEQLTQMDKNNEKRNKKKFDKFLLGQKQFVDDRAKKVRGYAKDWLGSVSEKQQNLISQFAQNAFSFEQLRYKNTLESQKYFHSILKSKNYPSIEKTIANAFRFPQPFHTPQYLDSFQKNQRLIAQLVIDLQTSSTGQQMSFFRKKVAELRADFGEMQKTNF